MMHIVEMSASELPLEAIVKDGKESSCGDGMTASFSVVMSVGTFGCSCLRFKLYCSSCLHLCHLPA